MTLSEQIQRLSIEPYYKELYKTHGIQYCVDNGFFFNFCCFYNYYFILFYFMFFEIRTQYIFYYLLGKVQCVDYLVSLGVSLF